MEVSISGILAQRYDAAGVPQAGEFNVPNSIGQRPASIALDADGDFVVAFQSNSYRDIHARRFNNVGVPLSNQFLVNTTTAGFQFASSIALDADGDFVVVWRGEDQNGNYDIYAQRFMGGSSAPVVCSGLTPHPDRHPRR